MLKVLSSTFFIPTIQEKLKINTKYAINVGIICQTPKCKKGCLITKIKKSFDFVKFKIAIV